MANPANSISATTSSAQNTQQALPKPKSVWQRVKNFFSKIGPRSLSEHERDNRFSSKSSQFKSTASTPAPSQQASSPRAQEVFSRVTGTEPARPAIPEEEEKEFVQEASAGPTFHPRETRRYDNLEEVQDKLNNERERARQHQERQKGNPDFRRAQPRHTMTYFKQSSESVNGREIGIAHDQGSRDSMEDEHLTASGNVNGRNYELFAIFDGHAGAGTAKFLKENLNRFMVAELEQLQTGDDLEIFNALKIACHKCDEAAKTRGDQSGSTAIITLRINQDVWVANVGDSRAILVNGNEVEQLSTDAKPDAEKIESSIVKRGGVVEGERLMKKSGEFYLTLSTGRAFNDSRFTGEDGLYYTVTARPKIVKVSGDEIREGALLLLMCDGITESGASSEDVGFRARESILNGKTPKEVAADLAGAAYATESGDNLSAMAISLYTARG